MLEGGDEDIDDPPAVEDTDNGSVFVVPANPQQGSTVTVTPSPDKGYEVAGVTVTDRNGYLVAVTDNGDGTFSFTQPAGKVTISVSYVCDGQTDNCPSYHLADVDTTKWYHLAVDFVMENGLMNGYGNGRFGPGDPITREQLAVMLWRYAGCPAATQKELRFTDADQVSSWAWEAMLWATGNGALNGYNGVLNHRGTATRAEAAQMLKNFCQKACIFKT